MARKAHFSIEITEEDKINLSFEGNLIDVGSAILTCMVENENVARLIQAVAEAFQRAQDEEEPE